MSDHALDIPARWQDQIIGLLGDIRDKVDIQNPASGPADNDFVWSVPVGPSSPMPYGPGDVRGNTTIEYYDGTRPSAMQFINMPNGTKYPYVMIQASDRSIELIDDITGLPVVGAGPGQIVTACIGESSRYRAILGAGVSTGRVTARFSSRPLQSEFTGNSGRIPLTDGVVSFVGTHLWIQGIFRNPSTYRGIIFETRFTAADALSTWQMNLITGPYERGVNGQGVAQTIRMFGVGAVPNGGLTGSIRGTGQYYQGSITTANMPLLGREFAIQVESNGAGTGVQFQSWYELVY